MGFRTLQISRGVVSVDSVSTAYDALVERNNQHADREYLRILHLAATTMESEIEIALELLLSENQLNDADQVKALVVPTKPEIPALEIPTVDLSGYDELFSERNELLPSAPPVR